MKNPRAYCDGCANMHVTYNEETCECSCHFNYYERLASLGWKPAGGNSRYDAYVKKNWRVLVSKRIPSTDTGIYFFQVRNK